MYRNENLEYLVLITGGGNRKFLDKINCIYIKDNRNNLRITGNKYDYTISKSNKVKLSTPIYLWEQTIVVALWSQ